MAQENAETRKNRTTQKMTTRSFIELEARLVPAGLSGEKTVQL
jgi:hypothetical protein